MLRRQTGEIRREARIEFNRSTSTVLGGIIFLCSVMLLPQRDDAAAAADALEGRRSAGCGLCSSDLSGLAGHLIDVTASCWSGNTLLSGVPSRRFAPLFLPSLLSQLSQICRVLALLRHVLSV